MKTLKKNLLAATIAAIVSTSYADSLVGTTYELDHSTNHAVKLHDGKVVQDFEVNQNRSELSKVQESILPFKETNIDNSYTGQAAIDFLGENFNRTAEELQQTPDYLKEQLLTDPTIHVDQNGKLFVIDSSVDEILVSDKITNPPVPSIPYTGDAFKLHSKPGAAKVIYLDFNGVITSTEGWKSGVIAAAYTKDADTESFSDLEKTEIHNIFTRVAEDFAPFDVDVTTEEPTQDAISKSATDDQNYGVRVVITSTQSSVIGYGGGGVAYIGGMTWVNTKEAPERGKLCWVFATSGLSNWTKAIAEAASHEVGHTVSLGHHGVITHDGINGSQYYYGHGSGDTSWAPIMGVGYYVNNVQWSNAAYPFASNPAQDDKTRISQTLPFNSDDWADTNELAVTMVGDSKTIITDTNGKRAVTNFQPTFGVINSSNDVDRFRFTTSEEGPVKLNVYTKSYIDFNNFDFSLAAMPDGNLDVKFTLFDANGTEIQSVDDQSKVSATITIDSLPAGSYYIEVASGKHDAIGTDAGYTNYGSMGQYFITGYHTNDAPLIPPTAVIDTDGVTGITPVVVHYSANNSTAGSGSIQSYYWEFGDGFTSTESNPVYTYNVTGTFTPRLTITNTNGDTSIATGSAITVYEQFGHSFTVRSIKETAVKVKKNTAFKAVVKVMTDMKKAFMNAKVHGKFTGTYRLIKNGPALKIEDSIPDEIVVTTDKKGTATFTTPTSWLIKGGATVKFEVTGIESPIDTQFYNKAKNTVTSTTLIKK